MTVCGDRQKLAPLGDRFAAFIEGTGFPCVGAKAALKTGCLGIVEARDLRSGWNDLEIHKALVAWAGDYRQDSQGLRSFAVLFEGPLDLDEMGFEAALWERLQSLVDKDAWKGIGFDTRVAADPDDPHFSVSLGGEAFFVVGLHPGASRPARRFERPALIFNLHDQFERLRSDGRYERMRERIIERDCALAGTVNPMLERHGTASEAAQYSGRAVGSDWTCPFRDPRARP